MAEKNKKRGGRRAHLNDFHVNLAGDYVYTGAHYSYVDQGRSRDRVQRELLGLSVAVVLAVVAGGCSDAPAMLNCWYVILLYLRGRGGGRRDLGGAPAAEGGGTHPGVHL